MTPISLSPFVHVHESPIVRADPIGGLASREVAVYERAERIPPDRAPDREPHVAGNPRAHPEPVIDRGVVGAPAEDDAGDAVPSAGARGARDRLAVLASVDAL